MFNLKISLLYFALIAAAVGASLFMLDKRQGEATKIGEAQLEVLPRMFEVHKDLREQRLEDFALRLAQSELTARLETLLTFREDFRVVDRLICSEEEGVKCDMTNTVFSEQRSAVAMKHFGDTTFTKFAADLLGRVKEYHPDWKPEDETSFTEATIKQLAECFGRGSTQCDWLITYNALQEVLPRMKRETTVGAAAEGPDVVLVFDSKGVGLASASASQWSNNSKYKDRVKRLRTFVTGRKHKGVVPVSFDLMKLEEQDETQYLVAMVPIVGKNDEFQGAILVGEGINKRIAAADKRVFDADVTYILEDKLLASTLEQEAEQKFLLTSANVEKRLKMHIVKNESWLAVSIPYYSMPRAPSGDVTDGTRPVFANGVAYGSDYQKLRVALAVKRSRYEQGFATLQTWIPVFGVGLFIIGLILFWLVIRIHLKPFVSIDQGVHEVINGNFDYVFPFDYREDLPSSMAQSLNFMTAVLLGKPLPEDEDQAQPAWDGAQLAGHSGGTRPQSGDLTIEDRPDGTEPPADLMREPAETYYKRLYAEYRTARKETGEPDDVITYVRFVEQLVKGERDLKAKLSCKHVRFTVKNRDGVIVMSPVPVA